jgi:hypothetical protein
MSLGFEAKKEKNQKNYKFEAELSSGRGQVHDFLSVL